MTAPPDPPKLQPLGDEPEAVRFDQVSALMESLGYYKDGITGRWVPDPEAQEMAFRETPAAQRIHAGLENAQMQDSMTSIEDAKRDIALALEDLRAYFVARGLVKPDSVPDSEAQSPLLPWPAGVDFHETGKLMAEQLANNPNRQTKSKQTAPPAFDLKEFANTVTKQAISNLNRQTRDK